MKTETEVYKVYFDKGLNSVVMEWNGYASSNQFREGTELMLNVLIQNNCSKVLAEIQDMTLIAGEDQKWLETNFLPRAIDFGFKSIAIIRPRSYFNKVAVENVSYKVDKDNLTVSFFDDSGEAKKWLMRSTNKN